MTLAPTPSLKMRIAAIVGSPAGSPLSTMTTSGLSSRMRSMALVYVRLPANDL